MTLLCRVAQNRKNQIAAENPRCSIMEKIETDETLGTEFVVITLKEGGEDRGFECVESGATFLMEG